jgi:hypothetical protein
VLSSSMFIVVSPVGVWLPRRCGDGLLRVSAERQL